MKLMISLPIALILLFLFGGCLPNTIPEDEEEKPGKTIFVYATDFMSGAVQWMPLGQPELSEGSLEVNGDASIKSYKKNLYIIEKFRADNIIKMDASNPGVNGVIYQTHLGDFWNPTDMVFLNDERAYISLLGMPYILIFDTDKGEVVDSILTRDYIYQPKPEDSLETATSPHAISMALSGTNLYVALQRFTGDFTVAGRGLVLKINTQTNKVEDTLYLKGKNPQSLKVVNGNLYANTRGLYPDYLGGTIEKLDFTSGTTKTLMNRTTLKGAPWNFEHKSGEEFYVLSYKVWGEIGIKLVDFGEGVVLKTLSDVTDGGENMYYDKNSEKLIVTERNAEASGIKIFDNKERLIEGPIELDAPPSGIALIDLSK